MGWGFLLIFVIPPLLWILFSNEEHGFTFMIIFYIIWGLSGYYGAWLLLKKGYGSSLTGCVIITGGAPILVPPFLGLIMYFWGKMLRKRINKLNSILCVQIVRNQRPSLQLFVHIVAYKFKIRSTLVRKHEYGKKRLWHLSL